MPIPITGLFEPSGGAGAFDLYQPEDIQAGNVNVILQAIAGGAFKGGSHATAPVGEIVAQVRTATGAPTHSASEGTICWNSTDNKFFVNNNGTTGWTEIASGGNSFATIACPNADNPVADSATDTLTLSGSSRVIITGNAAADSVAFDVNASDGDFLLAAQTYGW